MKKLVALLVLLSFASFACYNTYRVGIDTMKQLQTADGGNAKVVESKEGKNIEVTRSTRLFVRDVDSKRYMITPYNFKLTNSQLVASDRDYIFMLNSLTGGGDGEVDLLSTPKTVLLIGAGAAAVAGIIVVTVLTAGQKSFADQ
jgi:hypothetical protein